jgi:hypothetical protein
MRKRRIFNKLPKRSNPLRNSKLLKNLSLPKNQGKKERTRIHQRVHSKNSLKIALTPHPPHLHDLRAMKKRKRMLLTGNSQ